jgi:hypothetical protein
MRQELRAGNFGDSKFSESQVRMEAELPYPALGLRKFATQQRTGVGSEGGRKPEAATELPELRKLGKKRKLGPKGFAPLLDAVTLIDHEKSV